MSSPTIESFFVLEQQSLKLVFEYPLCATAPSYRTLLDLLVSSDINNDKEHVFAMTKSLVVYSRCLGPSLLLASICSSTMPPLVCQEFLGQVGTVLYDYFATGGANGGSGKASGVLTGAKIEAHSDTVSLIVNEAIDAGFPTITEPDTMRQFVPFQDGLLHKLLTSSNTRHPFPPQLDPPWRRAGVKHTNNELYVDVIESLDIVMTPAKRKMAKLQQHKNNNKRSSSAFYSNPPSAPSLNAYKSVISRAHGSVICQCHISGVPEIQMTLSNKSHRLNMLYFHPCIQQQQEQEKLSPKLELTFVPPDGEFRLFSYTIEDIPNNGLVNAEMSTGLGIDCDEFEIRIFTPIILKSHRGIENLTVDIVCDKTKVVNIRNLRISAGEFSFEAPGLGKWRFPQQFQQQTQGWTATLRGSLVVNNQQHQNQHDEEDKVQQQIKQININDGNDSTSSTTTTTTTTDHPPLPQRKTKEFGQHHHELFPKYLRLNYLCKGTLASTTKIDSVNILSVRGLSETVKPYKGVKYTTRAGSIIIRR